MAQASSPLLTLADFAQAARARLPREVWDFVAGGAGREVTLAANLRAFNRVFVVPRVLAGTSGADTAGRLLGTGVAMPVAVAPMAYQRLVHPDGEVALAAAAREAGVVFTATMLSSVPVEEITAVGAATWFQTYWLRDRARTVDLVARAEAAGCSALVLTVDVPRMGRRLRDMRNAFVLPQDVTAANLTGASASASAAHHRADGVSAAMVHTAEIFDPTLGWADIEWLRERTRLPLVLKGILDPADAVHAVEAGAAAIVVSNHGGRQLDGALPSLDALPAVVEAVGGRCPVLLDSGLRSGTDLLKAVALGAAGGMLGRPALWGLAVDGAQGATMALRLFCHEFEDAMALAGCRDLDAVGTLTARVEGVTA
jgi:4-hydroxymandelate oxidase